MLNSRLICWKIPYVNIKILIAQTRVWIYFSNNPTVIPNKLCYYVMSVNCTGQHSHPSSVKSRPGCVWALAVSNTDHLSPGTDMGMSVPWITFPWMNLLSFSPHFHVLTTSRLAWISGITVSLYTAKTRSGVNQVYLCRHGGMQTEGWKKKKRNV